MRPLDFAPVVHEGRLEALAWQYAGADCARAYVEAVRPGYTLGPVLAPTSPAGQYSAIVVPVTRPS